MDVLHRVEVDTVLCNIAHYIQSSVWIFAGISEYKVDPSGMSIRCST